MAILGTLLNSTYIANINAVHWPAAIANDYQQALEAIRSSIQAAHIVAQNIPNAQLSQMIISQSDLAFVTGAKHALLVSGIILAIATVVTVLILPSRVRGPQAEKATSQEQVIIKKTKEQLGS